MRSDTYRLGLWGAKMEYEFDVHMTVAALYDYNMYYTYTSASGIIGTAAGACFLLVYFAERNIYLLVAALLLILYSPITLFYRSFKQVKLNPIYKNALHYKMNDEGVVVSTGEEELAVTWDEMYKARSSNQSIMLYTSKKSAWIFPKSEVKEHRVKIIEMISTHMPPQKVNIKQ